MKRLLMGIAACALLITSCAKQEITEDVSGGQDQISFFTGLGKQSTKAAELMNSTLQTAASTKATGIPLRTYQMKDGAYEKWFIDTLWHTNKWQIESTRFRNTAKTRYVSYFPMTGVKEVMDGTNADKSTFETANFTDKLPQFQYTVAGNSALQKDLVAGLTDAVENQTEVILTMRHILSQVNFGTVGYPGANIEIQNIKLVGLYNRATYKYNATGPVLGSWGTLGTDETSDREATYDYYTYANASAAAQPLVPYTAKRGDSYIFGDGGNAGPGRATTTFYPVGTGNAWSNAPATGAITMGNSLILMPQDFRGDDAKVTFEYKITDKDGAYVVGGPTAPGWETGEFMLDFSIDGTSGTDYMSMWEPNFRYVYLIDFTDFLDGIALKFKVDVETYPWENYNKDETDGDDGEVTVKVAGQPSSTNMSDESFTTGNAWYIATQSETAPDNQQWAQVVRNEVWDLRTYDFTQIGEGNTFILNFQNVIFNMPGDPAASTTITLTLPAGYTAAKGAGVTIAGNGPQYVISAGNKSATAFVTITNGNAEYSTEGALKTAIEKISTPNATLPYKGSLAVDLTTMEPALTNAGEKMTVTFSKIHPNVGATTNGKWTFNSSTKVATWVRNDD